MHKRTNQPKPQENYPTKKTQTELQNPKTNSNLVFGKEHMHSLPEGEITDLLIFVAASTKLG